MTYGNFKLIGIVSAIEASRIMSRGTITKPITPKGTELNIMKKTPNPLRAHIGKLSMTVCHLLAFGLLVQAPIDAKAGQRWQIEDVLQGETKPFAIGHRGSGANLGEDPTRPIENTAQSVRRAFRDGIQIVEVDVQITKDGQVVAFHDDFLEDFTCINTLTFRELKKQVRPVSRLRDVLNVAHANNQRKSHPSGLMIIELKAPAPLCDPDDITEEQYVAAVIKEIRHRRMGQQVLLESFSPALLGIAQQLAPNIRRQPAANVLQFLDPATIEAVTGLPVTVIDKDDFGLTWADIGPVFRLPGYASFEEFVGVALALGSRSISLDIQFLGLAEQTQPGSGAVLIDTVHGLGMSVVVFTLNTAEEWAFVESLGADGIYIDDISLGLELQN
jgi:glycerophosphoryl diester phosphodiesterase